MASIQSQRWTFFGEIRIPPTQRGGYHVGMNLWYLPGGAKLRSSRQSAVTAAGSLTQLGESRQDSDTSMRSRPRNRARRWPRVRFTSRQSHHQPVSGRDGGGLEMKDGMPSVSFLEPVDHTARIPPPGEIRLSR